VLLDLLGELALEGRHLALDDALDLVGQVLLDVLLEAAQEERAQNLVQAPDDEERLLLVELDLVLAARVGKGRVEPLVERLDRAEDLGQDKVEERPQLGEVVLRAGERARRQLSRPRSSAHTERGGRGDAPGGACP